jgi:hypothetical protein
VCRFGTGYIVLDWEDSQDDLIRPLFKAGDVIFGASVGEKVFFLPCAVPRNTEQAHEIIQTAVSATLSYLRRTASELPVWVNEFVFSREHSL